MRKSELPSEPPPVKEVVHYTASYLMDPMHPVSVNLIGCGGTGSQVLNSLARLHSALRALDHPGLYVRAIDPDKVSTANMGRQLFSPADVDEYKCIALIARINRFFGTDWDGMPLLYNRATNMPAANITISCVDTGAAREEIKATVSSNKRSRVASVTNFRYIDEPYHIPFYWMDFGNMMDRGQMVIGTLNSITQPESDIYRCVGLLPCVDDLHPEIFKDSKKDNQGPSCSLAEALGKQDLFINSNLANMGLAVLWKMFREMKIRYHGLYLNLDNMSVNPIKIA